MGSKGIPHNNPKEVERMPTSPSITDTLGYDPWEDTRAQVEEETRDAEWQARREEQDDTAIED